MGSFGIGGIGWDRGRAFPKLGDAVTLERFRARKGDDATSIVAYGKF